MASQICKYCGEVIEIDFDRDFCPKCGKKLIDWMDN